MNWNWLFAAWLTHVGDAGEFCVSACLGMVERVSRELIEDPGVCGGQKVRLLAAPGSLERRQSAWVGGSILSSLSSFQAAWCSREEYEEHGPTIVQRKCY